MTARKPEGLGFRDCRPSLVLRGAQGWCVGSALVTPAQYANIADRCEPPRAPRGRRIFVAQCNLAKRMFYLLQHNRSADADPVASAWRAELSSLRRTAHTR